MEFSDGEVVSYNLKPSKFIGRCSDCLNKYEARSLILSNSDPIDQTKHLSAMALKNPGSQIVFTTVVANTYVIIVIGQFETRLLGNHSSLPLRTPVTTFASLLYSKGLMVTGNAN